MDGRVYCEKHANGVERGEDDEEDDVPIGGLYNPHEGGTRATKRTTRFIDLGLGFGGKTSAGGAQPI